MVRCWELALEEAMDVSWGRLRNELTAVSALHILLWAGVAENRQDDKLSTGSGLAAPCLSVPVVKKFFFCCPAIVELIYYHLSLFTLWWRVERRKVKGRSRLDLLITDLWNSRLMGCCVWRRCGSPSRWLRVQGSDVLNGGSRKLLNCVRAILRGDGVLHFLLICVDSSLLFLALPLMMFMFELNSLKFCC